MITEAVIRVILHCSRCNAPFADDEYDAGTILWTQDELAKHFPKDFSDWDDVQGWIRLGDRVVCFACWDYADDDEDARVEKPALPAAEAAKVNRAQAVYPAAEHVVVAVESLGTSAAELPATGKAGAA